MKKKPLGYLGGDIMSFGSNLARQYEYDKFIEMGLPVDVYSPVQNKSINDKSNMTEEENNHLAEKITAADIERLWNSDFVVMCPEQSAIGSLTETGCLFGWKYMTDRLLEMVKEDEENGKTVVGIYDDLITEIKRINDKDIYCHQSFRIVDLFKEYKDYIIKELKEVNISVETSQKMYIFKMC